MIAMIAMIFIEFPKSLTSDNITIMCRNVDKYEWSTITTSLKTLNLLLHIKKF
jgi:hypothetical protein